MTQISLLSGMASDSDADWRTQYPVNYIPVPKDTGISKGSLRAAPGLTQFATGSGVDRGSINWNGQNYRVSGTSLIRVNENGTMATIGAISGTGPVSMDYGPTYLMIVGDHKAWLYDGATLTQITDVDLGLPIDGFWVDGYFMFTDGAYLLVTELNNPFSIDPLKYGSSEADPDRIVGNLKLRNEVYALNRYTTEVFNNVGGTGFPFLRVASGMIAKGCVGTHAKALFAETFAWVGSGRNEPCSVYLANGGAAQKIATREVETRLAAYTEAQLATCEVEARADKLHQHLMIHLPNETMVYDLAASVAAGESVWFFLSTGITGPAAYRARHFTWCYGKWLCGDTVDARIGYMDESVITQYGEIAGGRFDTMFLYNEGRGAIVWSLELVGTTGRAPSLETPTVFHSYTVDGLNWSQERQVSMGTTGQTTKRVVFEDCGCIESIRGERFRTANKTPISWARLEATLEPLNA
jgi:hypothetical protein